jgi:isocitrate lyase
MTFVLKKVVDKFSMSSSSLDHEEQQYLQDVEAVKKWWTDSRWRYTKRPFTAEQIVQKRGTIKIQYPANDQAKKLWKLVEQRFAVSFVGYELYVVADA